MALTEPCRETTAFVFNDPRRANLRKLLMLLGRAVRFQRPPGPFHFGAHRDLRLVLTAGRFHSPGLGAARATAFGVRTFLLTQASLENSDLPATECSTTSNSPPIPFPSRARGRCSASAVRCSATPPADGGKRNLPLAPVAVGVSLQK